MCADIHYGQEQHAPLKGPNTDARDQSSPDPSHPACNTRPVHTDVPCPDMASCQPQQEVGSKTMLIWRGGTGENVSRTRRFRITCAPHTSSHVRRTSAFAASSDGVPSNT